MDALLERLAVVYYAFAGLVLLLPAARSRAVGGAGVALLGLAAAATTVAPGASGGFVTLNELIALLGLALVAVALLRALRRTDDRAAPLAPEPALATLRFEPLLLAALLLAALASHLLLLGLGAALALAFAARAAVRAARPAALLPLLAAAASLGIGFGLLLTIQGPESGRVAGLNAGPFSIAAERLLTLLLGGGSLLIAGVPPLQRAPWGRQLAPLSAILLLRVVAPGFPTGLVTWQVPAMLLLAAGLLWAALAGRWTQAAVAGGLLALWSGSSGGSAGSVLVAWGWLVETGAALAARRGVTLAERWRGIPALPAALAGLPALRSGLAAQVSLSVAAAAACIMGLLLQAKRGPRSVRAPLY